MPTSMRISHESGGTNIQRKYLGNDQLYANPQGWDAPGKDLL